MDQNYGFTANYGTPLTTSQTANYGTQNPGPTNVTPFMAETVRGEMMGTASDGSSLAAYSPIVHAVPMKIRTKDENTFVPEGTLVSVIDGKMRSAQHCTSSEDYVLVGVCNGAKIDIPNGDDETTSIKRIVPTASGCNGSSSKKEFVDTVSLAFKSVTRVRIRDHKIWYAKDRPTMWRPGQNLYAVVDYGDGINQICLFTDIKAFRAYVAATGVPLFTNKIPIENTETAVTLTGPLSRAFKIGTLVLPCNVGDHNMEDHCYVNLCSTQSIV